MPSKNSLDALGARERQIMAAVFRLGEASVGEVLAELKQPPSYSAVRTMIRLLEAKGFLQHRRVSKRYVYRPTQSHSTASRSALKQLMQTFFAGSATNAVAAILDASAANLTANDLERLQRLIDQAREKGK